MDFQTVATSSLVAAIVAFLLNRAWTSGESATKSRAILRGMLLELDHAEFCAQAYLNDSSENDWAPAYRIAVEFLKPGSAAVAERGHLKGDAARAIHQFYIAADEANRCLDLCEHLNANPEAPSATPFAPHRSLLSRETDRARVKFRHVLERLPAARAAASGALTRLAWFERQS